MKKLFLKFKRLLIISGLATFGLFILMFLAAGFWIGSSVKDHCQEMTARYQQSDCVEVLMQAVEDEELAFGERNSAIWALGQLGDKRALPVIEKFYTGNIPDREPWNNTLSQYEMKKAINLLRGGFNITSFVWRPSID